MHTSICSCSHRSAPTPTPRAPARRKELLQQLCLHLAALNGAPAAITGNEALNLWVQELLARAYSLHVVASNIRGWSMVGPTGSPVSRGSRGAALQLLHELLEAQRTAAKPALTPGKKRKAAAQGVDGKPGSSTAAAAAGATPKAKRAAAPAAAAAAPAGATPGTASKKKHSLAGGSATKQAAATPGAGGGARASTPGKKAARKLAASPKAAEQPVRSQVAADGNGVQQPKKRKSLGQQGGDAGATPRASGGAGSGGASKQARKQRAAVSQTPQPPARRVSKAPKSRKSL